MQKPLYFYTPLLPWSDRVWKRAEPLVLHPGKLDFFFFNCRRKVVGESSYFPLMFDFSLIKELPAQTAL